MTDDIRIKEDELNNVSGGMVFNALGYEGSPDRPWEVLANHNCEILGAFPTKEQACEYARSIGEKSDPKNSYNTMEVYRETVERLRANPNVY